jgi:hypothetical protein
MSTNLLTTISSQEYLESSPAIINEENLCAEASHLQLQFVWILWSHELKNKKWTIDSYNKVWELKTVFDVVQFLNAFPKLDMKNYHYFLMRDGISPTWEDPRNRDGGVCSFKTEITPITQKKDYMAVNVWNYLVLRLTGGTCHDDIDELNGISVSPKNNWAIIKLWNKTASNDLSISLPHDIKKKFALLSIKYKPNAPEY